MESTQDVLDDLNAPDLRQYTVTDPVEIAGVLARLRDARTRTTVYFNHEPGSMVTMVLDVAARRDRFVFDADQDAARNVALEEVNALAWRALLDGVRVEFVTRAPRRVEHGGRIALSAPLPDVLLRLQRRNAFRTITPIAHPLSAMLDPDGTGRHESKARVLDISALGLCLLVDSRGSPLSAGQDIARCRFELPAYGEIRCGLEVRYILSAGASHPEHFRRCGVQFRNLAHADEVLVSRYINDLQRERSKARPA